MKISVLSFFPVIPDVVSSQLVYIVNETATVTFQCTTAGIPSPMLSWFNGSAALNDSDSRVTIGDAGSQLLTSLLYQVTQNVTILNADSDDNGSYSCLAGNSVGTDEAFFELVVRSEYLEGVVHCTSCKNFDESFILPPFLSSYSFCYGVSSKLHRHSTRNSQLYLHWLRVSCSQLAVVQTGWNGFVSTFKQHQVSDFKHDCRELGRKLLNDH